MKPMTFEEWDKDTYQGQLESLDGRLELFESARIGMIPEDEAIRIPIEKEWPDGANGIKVIYFFKSIDDAYGVMPIAVIPRSYLGWLPSPDDHVFFYYTDYVLVGKVKSLEKDMAVIVCGSRVFRIEFEYLKPFDLQHIHKSWSDIPEGRNGN